MADRYSAPSTRQVLLGLFIVGQILFLASNNLIGYVQDIRSEIPEEPRRVVYHVAPGLRGSGHLWEVLESVRRLDQGWAETTGQVQRWSLFPTLASESLFPAVELRWDDGGGKGGKKTPWEPALFLSDNEPADLTDFLRVGHFRLRRYEANLACTLKPRSQEKPEQTAERWKEVIHDHVKSNADIIHAYFKWRLPDLQAKIPDHDPPTQMILLVRRYHIVPPEEGPPFWQGPHSVPLARWQPFAPWQAGRFAVEWYDPVTKRFKELAKGSAK